MSRRTTAFHHLSPQQIKHKIKTAAGFGVQKWLIIWNATVDPCPAKDIAAHTGVAVDTVHHTISRYNRFGPAALDTPGRGGRRRCYLSVEEEKQYLQSFVEKAARGERVRVGEIQAAFEARVGHAVAATTIYRLLARHKWGKLRSGTAPS